MSPAVLALLAGLSVVLLVDRRRPPWRCLLLGRADLGHIGAGPQHVGRGHRTAAGGGRRAATRRSGRSRSGRQPVHGGLAPVVDLLAVAVSAGHSLPGALRIAAREGRGPVAAAVADVVAEVDRGRLVAEAVEALPRRLGPDARPLATTLAVAAAAGTPLGPALVRLAESERRRARRAAETRARRLPVLMLGPLVGLVLPAFVVLTVVPAALASFGDRGGLPLPAAVARPR